LQKRRGDFNRPLFEENTINIVGATIGRPRSEGIPKKYNFKTVINII